MSKDSTAQKDDRLLEKKKVQLIDQEKKVWQEIMALTSELEKASKETLEHKAPQDSKPSKPADTAQKLTFTIQKLTDLEISFSGSKTHLSIRLLQDGSWQLRSKPT